MSPEASTVDGDQSVEQLRRELAEAREQQAATAGILRAISNSPSDLQGIFQEIATTAARLCDAYDAGVLQCAGDHLRLVAHHGHIPGQGIVPLSRGVVLGRAILDRTVLQVPDMQTETEEYPEGSESARRLGHRTIVAVPLIRDRDAIGSIFVRHTEVRPFTDRQIELLKTFADQAVIAIENTRLFEAEQASKRELQESLKRQTATADVLKIISRSTFDLKKIFETLAESAAHLCRAERANIWRLRGEHVQYVAAYGFEPDYVDYMHSLQLKPHRGMISGRAALERRIIHVDDVLADPEFTLSRAPKLGGFRTALGVPLMREG